MSTSDRVRWHCPNLDCNTWFVRSAEGSEKTAPRCICGRTMQKEGADDLGYLDFLKEETAEAEAGAEKR